MTSSNATAQTLGIYACHTCGLLSKLARRGASSCGRCGASLRFRKPDSLARASALLIAAYILYVPANILPLMETGSLFGSQTNTIMSGIVYLWKSGSWPLAAIVFVASVLVPFLKLLVLTLLVLSVRFWPNWRPHQRTQLYRMVELVGRWSMLDIYVVAVLVAAVQFQSIATVAAGPGAVAFGAVVVLSMLSAMAFDPRLIWDSPQKERSLNDSCPAKS